MKRLDFDAAIFDMDGLLIDSEPLWDAAKIHVFRSVGSELSAEMCAETMGFRQADMVRHWYERRPWTGPTPEEVEERVVSTLCARIRQGVPLLTGVEQVLSKLRAAGLQLAVASSSPERVIRTVLEAVGVETSFGVVRSAENEANGKPAPDVYLSAALALGVAPARCLVFEDSPAGVRSGLAAGMRVVAVPSAANWKLPVFDEVWLKLASLAEFRSAHLTTSA